MFALLTSSLLLLSSSTSTLALPQAITPSTVNLADPQALNAARQHAINFFAPPANTSFLGPNDFVPLGPQFPADYLFIVIDEAAPLNEDAITHLFERICGYIIDRKQAIPERIDTKWQYIFFNEGYYLGYHRVGESYTFLLEKFSASIRALALFIRDHEAYRAMHVRVATDDPTVQLALLGEIQLMTGVPPSAAAQIPSEDDDPSECKALPGENVQQYFTRFLTVTEHGVAKQQEQPKVPGDPHHVASA